MSYSLLDAGSSIKGEATQGLSDSSRLDQQRDKENASLAAAKKQGETTSMATGAVAGAMAGASKGASIGGWWGAAIGLVAGYLLS